MPSESSVARHGKPWKIPSPWDKLWELGCCFVGVVFSFGVWFGSAGHLSGSFLVLSIRIRLVTCASPHIALLPVQKKWYKLWESFGPVEP